MKACTYVHYWPFAPTLPGGYKGKDTEPVASCAIAVVLAALVQTVRACVRMQSHTYACNGDCRNMLLIESMCLQKEGNCKQMLALKWETSDYTYIHTYIRT